MKSLDKKLIAVTLALVLCACTSATKHNDVGIKRMHASGVNADVRFPDPSSAWLRGGDFVSVEALRRIGRGMSKDQVRLLIGSPHFNEGPFGPREWDYLFNFRTGKGDEFVQCQYHIVFNDGVTDQFYWREPACADLVRPKVVEVLRPISAGPSERFNLEADALFRFDKSGQDDMLPGGRKQLDELVQKISTTYTRLDSITVVGHTDRLGSTSYNSRLSMARAATVRDYLVAQRLPAAKARAFGVGESQPVAKCADALPQAALIACLQPDRRVELEVRGERK